MKWDANTGLSQLEHDLPGTSHDLTLGFTYNPAGQIHRNTRSNALYSWSGAVAVDRTYQSNALNQYTQSGSVTPTYDAKGNLLTAHNPPALADSYAFTAENKLSWTANAGGMWHDPLGRLYVLGSESRLFAYDGEELVAEALLSDYTAVVRRYVHGPGEDEPIVWYEGSGLTDRRFYHDDERGSKIAISNSSGAVITTLVYDEYGIATGPGGMGRFRYTGQKFLQFAGMHDFKARTYSPTLGRFLQPDPIGYGDGMNLYQYVGADPVNYIDATGLGKEGKGKGERNWTASPEEPEKFKTRPHPDDPNKFQIRDKHSGKWVNKSIALAAKYRFKVAVRFVPYLGWGLLAKDLYDLWRAACLGRDDECYGREYRFDVSNGLGSTSGLSRIEDRVLELQFETEERLLDAAGSQPK